ncbi:MAG: GNAT family N-acetyltransferase [Clostridia bacterium]|nr:GNAT family N-acetyltransferase [Clostridia bacterium]
MVNIKEVKSKRDIKEFVEFPLKLYKGNLYFVPPLYGDEIALFKKNTVYSEQAESVFYLAEQNGKTVGRIQGILQRVANEKWNQKRVRFTRFDCINDKEVAKALFDAIEKWAKQRGMNEIVGPLGYSDLDREGLLIEGFDQISTFEEQYNYEYYSNLIEYLGYKKEVDWVEYKLSAPDKRDERLERISSLMMEKYGLRLGFAKNAREFVKKWGNEFFDVLDETYVAIYQSVPFTPKMKKNLINNFKLILNVKYATVILDKNDKIVGFGLAFPAIGQALQKSGGRLSPSAIIKVLKAINKPKVIDLALIGVVPEYRNKAIATAIINGMVDMLTNGGIEYAETNLNLETNANIRNQWKSFNCVQHKRRRSYVKKIED